jgi:hypothetical protein
MRVFICGIIQGSHKERSVHEQSYRERLKQLVMEYMPEAEVYCPVSLHPESLSYDDPKAFQVLEESIDAARVSQLLIAYLPEASMGSAIEMWEAKNAGAKVISITGLTHNWVIRYASDLIVPTIDEFEGLLKHGKLQELLQ